MDTPDRIIGKNIVAARNKARMTRARLAAVLAVPVQQLHAYETGKARVDAVMLFLICDTLKTRPSELMRGVVGAAGPRPTLRIISGGMDD